MQKRLPIGVLALLSMVLCTLLFSPIYGWLAMSIFTLGGSAWGFFFGEKIQLRYFGKKFLLEGKAYRLYCLLTFLIGIGIAWFVFASTL